MFAGEIGFLNFDGEILKVDPSPANHQHKKTESNEMLRLPFAIFIQNFFCIILFMSSLMKKLGETWKSYLTRINWILMNLTVRCLSLLSLFSLLSCLLY